MIDTSRRFIVAVLMLAVAVAAGCGKEQTKSESAGKNSPVFEKAESETLSEPKDYFYEISAGAKNIYIGKDYQWRVTKVDAGTGERSQVKAQYSSENPNVLEISDDGLAKGKSSEYTAVNISFEGMNYRAEVLVLDPTEGKPADGGIGLQNPVYMNPDLLMHTWLIREEKRGNDKYIEIYIGMENIGDDPISFKPEDFRLVDKQEKTYETIPPEPDPESNPDAYNEISSIEVIKGDMNFGEVAFRLPADGPPPIRFEYNGTAGPIMVYYPQLMQMYQ